MKKDLSLLLSAAKDAVAVLGAIEDVPEYRRERVRLALHDAIEKVAKTAGPPRCSPHNWKLPVVGDDALSCDACGRTLKFLTEITPSMQASIIAAYEQRLGPEAGDTFRKAFHAAFAAERERVNEATAIATDKLARPQLPAKTPRTRSGPEPAWARPAAQAPSLPHSPRFKVERPPLPEPQEVRVKVEPQPTLIPQEVRIVTVPASEYVRVKVEGDDEGDA